MSVLPTDDTLDRLAHAARPDVPSPFDGDDDTDWFDVATEYSGIELLTACDDTAVTNSVAALLDAVMAGDLRSAQAALTRARDNLAARLERQAQERAQRICGGDRG